MFQIIKKKHALIMICKKDNLKYSLLKVQT